jgi:large subunit ribosomal protein L24
MSKWIKKGDRVVVISGNDKGIIGSVISRKGERVHVQGVNIRKKHVKSRSQTQPSRIIEIEGSIHVSNLCLCDEDGKRIKLKVRERSNGKKELYYLDGEKEVMHREIRKGT